MRTGTGLRQSQNSQCSSVRAKLSPALLRVITACVAGLLSIAAPTVATAANFAQSNQVVTPAPADAHRLAAYFTPPYAPGPMPPRVHEILLRSAPPDLPASCAAMVDGWGAAARGSSRVTARILGVADGNAWIAYRCDSRLPQFTYDYSERLAAFNSSRGAIQFLDLAAPQDPPATLYHVGFSTTLKLIGAEDSAAFEVFAVEPAPRNSATNHAARSSENRYAIVANSTSATRVALTLVTARSGPDAVDRDSALGDSSEYRATLRFDHDIEGHLTFINVYHRDSTVAAKPHFGLARYAWSEATLTFVSVKPVPIKPIRRQRLPPQPYDGQLAN
jgi:hypothetical protein